MSLVCLSFSHKHVPIALREQLHFDNEAIANACARFRCGQDNPTQILELVVLSTCNRTEIYAFTSVDRPLAPGETIANELCYFVAEARGVEPGILMETGSWLSGDDVVKHLCRVASGLESLVLGEPQILGQVGDAMKTGLIMNSCGAVLAKLFQAAIKAGRRARNETDINRHSQNISTVAVNTAERELENLDGKTVVLLGAGEMSDLALEQLRKKNATDINVVNRTIYAANELAEKHNGKAFVFEQIGRVLPRADVLITSTGAPHTLITKEMIQLAMATRSDRKMVILDIAVPRDVDESVDEIENVVRLDIDDLQTAAGSSHVIRSQQIPQVESIVELELQQFISWLRSVGAEPTIAELRKKNEEIRKRELTRLESLLPNLTDQEREILERFSKSLVKKILHDPTSQLRALHGTRNATDHAAAIRELFKLNMDLVKDTVETGSRM